MSDFKTHWENIYKTKSPQEVSWYSPHLAKSLELIQSFNLPKNAAIIDIGGGASTFPDDLLAEGFHDVTVLDISSEALEVSKKRLGNKASTIQWLESDVTKASIPVSRYDLWHDRAVFHFLTKLEDRQKYVNCLDKALKPGGHALIATFGPSGPLKCSGLEIVRYSTESLQKEFGDGFLLEKHSIEIQKTPFYSTQQFLYCLFKKK